MNNPEFEKLFNQEMMLCSKEELKAAAQGLYDIFESYIEAGFTREEALMLIMNVINSFRGQ